MMTKREDSASKRKLQWSYEAPKLLKAYETLLSDS